MMTFTCTKCARLFLDATAGQGLCPFCRPSPAIGQPPPPLQTGGRDLRLLARRQRWLLWLVLAALVANVLAMLMDRAMPLIVGIAGTVVSLGLVIMILVGVVQLMVALRANVVLTILCALLTFAPCVNLLVLMIVNMVATGVLRKAGLKVGFMGVTDAEVVRRLSPNLCRQCGYDLTGNVSGRCPECGTMIPRAMPLAVPM